jgi:hypothetical protein
MSKNISFERKLTKDGKENPKYVDVLDVDKPIAGQNFCCISFLTPEKILKEKEHFIFEKFLNKWDFVKSMEKFIQFLNFVSFKYKITSEILMKDFEDFVEDEKQELLSYDIANDYKNFLDKYEEEIMKEFNKVHSFQTSTRGVKIRGSYPSQEEAELRCKILREIDPSFDIFVGPVGQWLMWDPEAYKTGRVEYMEEELNKLMHEKIKNETNAKQEFDQRIKETKKKAIEENIKNAEKTGNLLTQNIDEEGNLIGISNTTQEKVFGDKGDDLISVTELKDELFEGDNIVLDKKSKHGIDELIGDPFKMNG